MPDKLQPAIDRYQNECRRLFEVLDRRLSTRQWLAGDYSIADIANWAWVRTYKWSGVSVEGLEHLQRWLAEIRARPAVERGIAVPFKLPIPDGEDSTAKRVQQAGSSLITR